MNKSQLAHAVAEAAGITKTSSAQIVETIFGANGVIAKALTSGDKVNLQGFGTFKVHNRKARIGTNPATKAKIEIPARKLPKFTAGKALKAAV